jgi:probable addiction module antidote protein
MVEKLIPWDPVKYLRSKEDVRYYLESAVDEDSGDGRLVRAVLGNIARALSEDRVKHEFGMTGEEIRQALSEDSSLSFATLSCITRALGMKLQATMLKDSPAEEICYRTISREEAQGEIVELLAAQPDLCYDDISDRLRIEMEIVVEICLGLEE